MTRLDSLTARAQVGITLVFVLGYFTILFALILGFSKMQDGIAELVSTLVSVLTAVVIQICSYWFARHRNKESTNVSDQDHPGDSGRGPVGPHYGVGHRVFQGEVGGAQRVGRQGEQGQDTAHQGVRGGPDEIRGAGVSGRDSLDTAVKATPGAAGGT